jgi:vacuolar protein sorting-associated protein 1
MQACYVNTTHPDFINGHKVRTGVEDASALTHLRLKAMAIVTERLNANKPQPQPNDPKKTINNNKDLDVEIKKEEPSFFGSFFQKAKGAPAAKKGVAAMEAASIQILTLM